MPARRDGKLYSFIYNAIKDAHRYAVQESDTTMLTVASSVRTIKFKLHNKNRFIKMVEDKYKQQEQPKTSKKDWKKWLNHKWVVQNIPFFLFLALLAVLYIYNGHHADKLTRKMSATEKHIKELEYEFKTLKSEVIFRSKASELVKAVEPLGLKELTAAPVMLSSGTVE